MPFRAFVAVLLAALLLVAGCGSSDKSGSSGSSSSTTSSGSASTSVGGSGGGTPSVPSATADRAAKQCKEQVSRAAGLSGDVKKGLEKTCDKAAHGDEKAARQASEEVCVKIAEQAVPAGPARDQTIAACKKTAP